MHTYDYPDHPDLREMSKMRSVTIRILKFNLTCHKFLTGRIQIYYIHEATTPIVGFHLSIEYTFVWHTHKWLIQ